VNINVYKARKFMKLLTAIGIGSAVMAFPMYRYYVIGGLIVHKIMANKKESRLITVKKGSVLL
jgi:hypothetical protein